MGVNCYIPQTLTEALDILSKKDVIIMAGGSDLMVSGFRTIGVPPSFEKDVMVIRNLKELSFIKKNDKGELEIGACTTSATISNSRIVPWCLRQAAGSMGAVALRNSATIGGNVANASPKGDTPGPLYALDAIVVLKSKNGERRVPIFDFVLGLKNVDRKKDELIYKIVIPYSDDYFTYHFYKKIGRRAANAISKLTLTSLIKIENGKVKDYRLATTACGVKTNRSKEVENIIIGKKVTELSNLVDKVATEFDKILSPRAMREYRKEATSLMIKDFLFNIINGDAKKHNS